jgi:hypothetical protein
MIDYRITPEGSGYQVHEALPDGRVRITGRFQSEASARSWIDDQVKLARRSKKEVAANWNSLAWMG